MSRSTLSEEQRAHAGELVEALRPRLEQLLHDAAARLAANQGAPLGANEFALRDLLLQAGADLLTAALARKKTDTLAPR